MLFCIPISSLPGQAGAALFPRRAFPALSRAAPSPSLPGSRGGRCEALPAPGSRGPPGPGLRGRAWIWRESIKSRREARPPSYQSRRGRLGHRTMINPNYYPWGYDGDNGESPARCSRHPGERGPASRGSAAGMRLQAQEVEGEVNGRGSSS